MDTQRMAKTAVKINAVIQKSGLTIPEGLMVVTSILADAIAYWKLPKEEILDGLNKLVEEAKVKREEIMKADVTSD